MSLKVVRGRLVAGLALAAAAVLSLPTILWPTWTLTLSDESSVDSGVAFTQQFWTWGRVEYVHLENLSVDQLPRIETTALGPFLHVAVIVLALVGAGAWLLRRGPDGRVLGAVGAGLLWAQVAQGLVGRTLTERRSTFGAPAELFTAAQTAVGTCENAAFVAASIAVLAMASRAFVRVAILAWRAATTWAAQARARADSEDQPPHSRVVAIREVDAEDFVRGHDETFGAGPERHGAVGFTDRAPDDTRFEPPDAT